MNAKPAIAPHQRFAAVVLNLDKHRQVELDEITYWPSRLTAHNHVVEYLFDRHMPTAGWMRGEGNESSFLLRSNSPQPFAIAKIIDMEEVVQNPGPHIPPPKEIP